MRISTLSLAVLTLLLTSVAAFAGWGLEPAREYSISTHESPFGVSCVLDEEGVKCWTLDNYGDWHFMEMRTAFAHPKSISVTGYSLYVVDDTGIHAMACGAGAGTGGYCTEYTSEKEKLAGGYAVAARYGNLCILKAEGAECASGSWGWKNYIPPALKSPRQIAVSEYQACALDSEGVKCWGGGSDHKVPVTHNAKMVSMGRNHGCVLDDNGVQCWGDNGYGQTNVPPLKNPTAISTGDYYSCAVDETGLHCWGQKTELPASDSVARNIRALGSRCWSGTNGVYCVGRKWKGVSGYSNTDGYAWTKVPFTSLKMGPSEDYPSFHLSQFSQFLGVAADRSAPMRAQVLLGFRQQAKVLEALPASRSVHLARYLVALFSRPVLESSETEFFLRTGWHAYENSVNWIGSALNLYKAEEIPADAQTRLIALRGIGDTLAVVADFLPTDDREKLGGSLRALGQAKMDPMDDAKLRVFFAELDASRALFDKLHTNSKTAFLVDTIDLMAGWLKEKVK